MQKTAVTSYDIKKLISTGGGIAARGYEFDSAHQSRVLAFDVVGLECPDDCNTLLTGRVNLHQTELLAKLLQVTVETSLEV